MKKHTTEVNSKEVVAMGKFDVRLKVRQPFERR